MRHPTSIFFITIPNFDTSLLPFSFEQLFSLNQYTGDDRLQNANQVTFALTSNLLDANSGDALLSANIGFIYYIENQRVCLTDGCTLPNYHFLLLWVNLSFTQFLTGHYREAWCGILI